MRRTCKRKPRQGGFFLLPNEIFTLGLRAGEIAVYAYLLFCEDRETHLCYPSFRKIGEMCIRDRPWVMDTSAEVLVRVTW